MLTTIVSMIATIGAAIYTAFILPLLQDYLKTRVTQYNKQREEEESNRKKINLTYLNPLRLWLEENYVRIKVFKSNLHPVEKEVGVMYCWRTINISHCRIPALKRHLRVSPLAEGLLLGNSKEC